MRIFNSFDALVRANTTPVQSQMSVFNTLPDGWQTENFYTRLEWLYGQFSGVLQAMRQFDKIAQGEIVHDGSSIPKDREGFAKHIAKDMQQLIENKYGDGTTQGVWTTMQQKLADGTINTNNSETMRSIQRMVEADILIKEFITKYTLPFEI